MENIKFIGAANEVQKIYSDLGLIVPVGDLDTGKSPVVQVLPATSTTDSITATFNVISNAEISALSYVVNEGEPVTVTPATGTVTISLTELEKNSGPYTITLTAVNENGSTDSIQHVALQPYTDWAEPESVLAGNKFVADGVEMVGEIVTKDSTDLTVSERTVTVPAGYYAENASASVSSDYIIPTGSTSITTNGTDINIAQYATANVNVQPVLETVPITPTTSAQTITPTTGYDGIGTANVAAVTSSIDANIAAENIKDGVTILGVTGNYQGSGGGPTDGGAVLSSIVCGEDQMMGMPYLNVNFETLPSPMDFANHTYFIQVVAETVTAITDPISGTTTPTLKYDQILALDMGMPSSANVSPNYTWYMDANTFFYSFTASWLPVDTTDTLLPSTPAKVYIYEDDITNVKFIISGTLVNIDLNN